MAKLDLICCVVNMGDASKIFKIANKHGIQGGTISIAHGTVHSRFLEFLKLNEIRKEFVSLIVDKERSGVVLQSISDGMAFDKSHHGIAFSHTISEMVVKNKNIKCDENVKEVKENMYKAIYVVVEKGNAERVVEVATQAGARGGTIINARGAGIAEAQKFFSLEIEPEKEKVFIITKADMKDKIVEAIMEHIEIEAAGNGIIYVLDVGEAYGLH